MADEETPKQVVDMDQGLPASMCRDPSLAVTWTNRRRMAWYSFWSFLVLTIAMLALIYFSPDEKKLDQMVNVYFYFVSVIGAIILGYFGTTTIPFMSRKS